MTKKKSEPNPIEEAIGDRAKPKNPTAQDGVNKLIGKAIQESAPPLPQNPSEIPDVPSPQEMLSLEELNRRTVERLQDQYSEEPQTTMPIHRIPKVTVLKPENQPATKTSSPESPPQKIDFEKLPSSTMKNSDGPLQEYTQEEADEAQKAIEEESLRWGKKACSPPAEEVELTALRQYILEDGFVLATVAFHIVSLCAQPMTTPSTTNWDFRDRAMIPDMVLALLNQPGYLEGIWPSLRIVMGTNKGNAAWTAGIATTIAFFDVIRTLPTIVELKNETEKAEKKS